MNEQERAEEHLRTIRRLMERATIYRAISAPTALVGGLLSLATSGIWWFEANSPAFYHPNSYILLWLLVLLLTAGTNVLFIAMGAKKRNEPVFSASMKAALVALFPAFLVAGVFTLFCFDWESNTVGDASVSVAWAICYGLGLLATSHFAPRSLTLLGWAFLGAGLVAVLSLRFDFLLGIAKILDIPSFFMAGTFGLFHLIYAACAWPRAGSAPEP